MKKRHSSPSNPSRPARSALALSFGLIAILGCSGSGGSGGSGGTAGAGGGSSTSTAGSGGSTTSVTSTLATTCEEPVSLQQEDGSDSGYVKCKDGSFDHATAPATCNLVAATDSCDWKPGYGGNCKTGADCVAHPNGYCEMDPVGGVGLMTCTCAYQCQTDADCDAGQVCGCGYAGSWPGCIAAKDCKQNTDCPSGECGLQHYSNGCFVFRSLACRTPSAECRVDTDCPVQSVCSDGAGSWTCNSYNCTM